jgi:hypothetical protein
MKPEILEHQIAHASYLTVERLRIRLTDGACRSRTDRRRKATDSGSCATPAATRPLRLFFFCFSRDRQVPSLEWLEFEGGVISALFQ